jgi:FkbM family methyltransferase
MFNLSRARLFDSRKALANHSANGALDAKLASIEARLNRLQDIEAKLDRMWLHLDFLRTHSAAYLGDGVALTYLVDETPILVNSHDYYGPMNLINGGRYEEENVEVLFSFLEDGAVFLDIGANLGLFSLRIADRIRRNGRVFAFEPHPMLVKFARHSIDYSGLSGLVTVFNLGLSDTEAATEFRFEKGHLGGGAIGHSNDAEKFDNVTAKVKRFDDLFGPDFKVDLVKIDVEGHELAVLRGMRETLRRSPSVKVMFEKLGVNAGYEDEIESLFHELGFELYGIVGEPILAPLAAGALATFSGYALASRPGQIDNLDRRRFSIYPSQLSHQGNPPAELGEKLIKEGAAGTVLFHGPYWFLQRATWELRIHGSISGQIDMILAERYGYATQSVRLSGGQLIWRFANERDLVRFELVARAAGAGARVEIDRLELVRVG